MIFSQKDWTASLGKGRLGSEQLWRVQRCGAAQNLYVFTWDVEIHLFYIFGLYVGPFVNSALDELLFDSDAHHSLRKPRWK